MSFQNYVCWKSELLPQVMNPDAFQMENHLFLATHDPMRMRRVERSGAAPEEWKQEQFRDAFLSEGGDYLLSAVLGHTGSGKSHLVRWLWLNIPRSDERHIVLIPRHGNNLKRVVENILHGMEGPVFDGFRERLNRSGEQLSTPDANRQAFLNHLSIAVGKSSEFALDQLPTRDAREERDFLMESLPALLLDSTFRVPLLREGGIIDELTNHAIGRSHLQGRNNRREFTLDDLNVHEWTLDPSRLTYDAKDIYAELRSNEAFRSATSEWINKHLPRVFRHMLNLGGDDLRGLMNEMRASLREEGRELILLIEDLSNLQGIDNALLEALLVRPNDPNQQRHLCGLRVAIAVTTGYFEGLPENVRDRVALAVTLDVQRPDAGNATIAASELANFAARYLNAVRLPPEAFQEWQLAREEATNVGKPTPPLPSACAPCPYRERCHSGFLAVDGLGLYPFTPFALSQMTERVAVYMEKGKRHFNPRAFIQQVLSRTLSDTAPQMERDSFPEPASFTRLGLGTMRPEERAALRQRVPEGRFEQVRTVLEWWGQPDFWPDPAVVIEAFKLPFGEVLTPRPSLPPLDPGPPITAPAPPEDLPNALPDALQRLLDDADAWSNGAYMSNDLAQRLREHLYAGVNVAIDWDCEGFVRSFHSGEGGASQTPRPFRRISFSMERQPTQQGRALVQIRLPFEGDKIEALALTFKGMLLYAHHGHWNFEDGWERMSNYAELIERCAREVLHQLQQLPSETQAFDPVPAAVELLSIGAALCGRPIPSQRDPESYINALFLNWKEECKAANHAGRSAAWRDLVRAFESKGDELVSILKSRVGLTKGGRLDLQMLDTSVLVKPLREIRASWQLKSSVPEGVRSDYRSLAAVHRVVTEKLSLVVEEEWQRLAVWRASIEAFKAPETPAISIVKAVRQLGERASEAGVKPSQWHMLEQPLVDFSNANFDRFLQSLSAVDDATSKNSGERLDFVGRTDFAMPMARGTAFFNAADAVLNALGARVQSTTAATGGNATVEAMKAEIDLGLEQLCSMTMDLTGQILEGEVDADANGSLGGVVYEQ